MATASNNAIAEAIYEEAKGKTGKALADSLRRSAAFLGRKGLLGRTSLILEALEGVVVREEGKMTARVRSAGHIGDTTRESIKKLLHKHYPGAHFTLEERLDPALGGGVRIEVGNDVIDLSVRSKVRQLETYLQNI